MALSAALLLAAALAGAAEAESPVLASFDFDGDEVETGPYTLIAYEHARGRVTLTSRFRLSGIRSVEMIAESPGWYSYDLPDGLRPKAWGGRYRGQIQKWFAVRFTGPEDEVVLNRPGHKPEFDAWRWADLHEVMDLIVPFKRAVYSQVLRDFAPLARRAS